MPGVVDVRQQSGGTVAFATVPPKLSDSNGITNSALSSSKSSLADWKQKGPHIDAQPALWELRLRRGFTGRKLAQPARRNSITSFQSTARRRGSPLRTTSARARMPWPRSRWTILKIGILRRHAKAFAETQVTTALSLSAGVEPDACLFLLLADSCFSLLRDP
jgi:hypothetical protein